MLKRWQIVCICYETTNENDFLLQLEALGQRIPPPRSGDI